MATRGATDPYAMLGVARTASEADIKKAYRKLAKELHPDKNRDNPKAAERFGQVSQAYDLLSDKDKRARFDRGEIDGQGNPTSPFGGGFGGGGGGQWRGQTAGPGGFAGNAGFEGFGQDNADLSDLFEGLFGAGGARGAGPQPRAAPPKGANIAYRLAVSFVDAATQAPQRITLADGKTIDLKLPAGIDTGSQMRLPGKGRPGAGGPGDAIVTLDVASHPFFKRDGDNIRLELPITLDEAIRGGKIKVPTVDGAVMVAIPANTSSGKTLRLKAKGFTTKSDAKSGGRGDQLVTVLIALPADDPKLAALVDDWSDTRNVRADFGV